MSHKTKQAIIAIDQGTTSSRTILFSIKGNILYSSQQEIPQIYPDDGWVEHDPDAIWSSVESTLKDVLNYAQQQQIKPLAIAITNQRETTLVWDRTTGKAVYNAIVWQDRRTADYCEQLKSQGLEPMIQEKTGLLLDPYFSASKVKWILDNVNGARQRSNNNELAFGTVDSFLIYRLTDGKNHVTDATNASRTQLFNIETQQWDNELLNTYNIPTNLLPEVLDCAHNFGTAIIDDWQIPILAVAGDQQAASIGQCCFSQGSVKSTYGTGCFVLVNTGSTIKRSKHRLLSTVAYRLNNQVSYAVEGSIFIAGAAVQWLRDELQIISSAAETEAICANMNSNQGLYLVPAFTGLGAPHWNSNARGSLIGITRATNKNSLVRATIESICYQTVDLLKTMQNDTIAINRLKVDGGMAANNWMLGFLADITNVSVERPTILETTALGVAYLACLQLGIYDSLDAIEHHWKLDSSYQPTMSDETRTQLITGWNNAVQSVLS